jgi:UDP-N-acetylmuramate dehydrogenase
MIINKESGVPNSLSVPSVASFVVKIKSKEEILEANDFAKKEGLPLIPIGEGTNIVPRDYIKAIIAILDTKGIKTDDDYLKVQAGEKWDNAVKFAVDSGLSGIEALSAIPGKTGASSIQNIGAYGLEISNTLEKVEVYDKEKGEFLFLSNKECQFGYRNSLFKKFPDRFIITSINLKLSKEKPKIPKYKDIEEYFKEKNNSSPNLKEMRKAIIEIRKNKLPDPNIIPNAGSYFINPILKNKKISAGWLIEQVGLKGVKIGKIEISSQNALVLTNPNRANFEEIMEAEDLIKEKVFQKFAIILKREPRIIG